jgi:hypothetical protein
LFNGQVARTRIAFTAGHGLVTSASKVASHLTGGFDTRQFPVEEIVTSLAILVDLKSFEHEFSDGGLLQAIHWTFTILLGHDETKERKDVVANFGAPSVDEHCDDGFASFLDILLVSTTSSSESGTTTASLVVIEGVEEIKKEVSKREGGGMIVWTIGILFVELIFGHYLRALGGLISVVCISIIIVISLVHVDI